MDDIGIIVISIGFLVLGWGIENFLKSKLRDKRIKLQVEEIKRNALASAQIVEPVQTKGTD